MSALRPADLLREFSTTRSAAGPRVLRPLIRECPADLETPVGAYIKLAGDAPAFLLESVLSDEHAGRYSFIGLGPFERIELRGGKALLAAESGEQELDLEGENPLSFLRRHLAGRALIEGSGHPPLFGGAVGYFGYDLARSFERLPQLKPDLLGLPEALLLLPETLLVFDHSRRSLQLITAEKPGEGQAGAEARLDMLERRLAGPLNSSGLSQPSPRGAEPQSNFTRAEFEAAVQKAREHIAAGDVYQLVLSQRLSGRTEAQPLQIYRALRMLNPSPYMFYLNFGELKLIGSSPEELAKLSGRRASLRPIAGTRPRSADGAEDAALELELLASAKERSEHSMLVDLGRNDLNRVCEAGSVGIAECMKLERYSHVMHLVSRLNGELRSGCDMFDLLESAFPAGTLTGAPKIRAMQLIEELEPSRRGAYGGAVGYLGSDGSMDSCITIRTIVMQGQSYHLQAGAGIVHESEPAAEYMETLHKMAALREAIRLAEEGL